MSVLAYIESEKGIFKKNALEVTAYANNIANQLGVPLTAVAINATDVSELSQYGVTKVLQINNDKLEQFNAKAYANAINQAAVKEDAKIIVLSSTINSKYLAPLLAVKLKAAYVSNIVAPPTSLSPFTVKQTVFTNKAFVVTSVNTEVKVLGISKNSFGLVKSEVETTTEPFAPTLDDADFNLKTISVDQATNQVSIADAEIVVSGGRGLKGAENWHLIEDLASVLGAATACSKPVSDLGWRPHSEHVGQTGKPVASNLYIAIGISGAIQHLAGVSASKTKVVINIDPEAPFFKAADYGVVGDAFEVVPILTEKLKQFKAQNT